MSEIKVDKISPQSGTALAIGDSGDTITIPSGATITNSGTANGFGAASLKTVQTYVTATSSQSLTDDTWANITNLNATITPTSGTTILITVKWSGESSKAETQELFFALKRDTTLIGTPAAASSRPVVIATTSFGYHGSDADSTCDSSMYQYLDTGAGTGSAVTYYATAMFTQGASTLYNNRTVGDADNDSVERPTSSITLQEVVAP